jgi:hypothetical protein
MATAACFVCGRRLVWLREPMTNPVGKPDAGNRHVRFDERGWETGRRCASVPAPILDSTVPTVMAGIKGFSP